MKKKPRQSQPSRTEPDAQAAQHSASIRSIPHLSAGRGWLFRFLALLIPFLSLVGLEMGLRVCGFGYSTALFKKVHFQGQTFLVDNESFSLRFFPPELARWPTSFKFEPVKPPDTTRIFIFGESAAMGDPQPAYGAARYMEVLLRRRYPKHHFQVVNLGITAINSHVILPIARECACQNGDIWIIYMGNNEMVGPYGAATVFGSRAPSRGVVQFALALQKTRIGQLLMALVRKLSGKPAATSWGGMQMFLQNQIHPSDPRRERVYQNFAANLKDIVQAGQSGGAKVILSTVSVNLKDCPPFASLANSNLPPATQKQFQELLAAGINQEKEGQFDLAAGTFQKACALDPDYAEAQFRWGDCLLHLTNSTAREHFQRACDLDALPFRADTRINTTIRRQAKALAGAGVVFCDAEQEIQKSARDQVAGDESFFEHVHFNFDGNYRLGLLWAGLIEELLPDSVRSKSPAAWSAQAPCERALGLTVWNRSFVLDSVISRMSHPPLSSHFNNPTRMSALQTELRALQAQQADTNMVMRSGQELVDAIQLAPQDPFLEEGFANFLEAVGDRKQAASAYQKALTILPEDFYTRLQLGRLYGQLGRPAEGEPLLESASRQRASVPDAWAELGNVQMMLHKYNEALTSYTRCLKLRPRETAYICFQANALARLNRVSEAIDGYRRALQLQADLPEAHFELAGLLATQNELSEATKEYAEAIRLNPRYVVAHINLGVMFARQDRLDEAIKQFEIALQIEPANASANQYLQQVSQRRGRKP